LLGNFDYRYCQVAYPGLILAGYLRPGAQVILGRLAPAITDYEIAVGKPQQAISMSSAQ
jgi:hypothetical protein